MEHYGASTRNSYIMYMDANSLYGWAISQPLPTLLFQMAHREGNGRIRRDHGV